MPYLPPRPRRVARPRKLHSESNVSWLPVEGFGESLRRSSELRREEERSGAAWFLTGDQENMELSKMENG